ncbi:EF-hand domain-containing protein [Lysobacter enzymogenes]|uniref:EF-hand domain-containing protein n=1 Tax=Lysobacter enzymogenes TaxID=69 RepID=UPI001F60CBAF|nr:hypothetical protein [Lysobacter enzymogenes]
MKRSAVLMLGLSLAATANAATTAQSDLERAYIDSAFAAVDSDKNQVITRKEFDAFMTARIAKQRIEFDKGFAAADVNGDGGIDRNEAKIHEALVEHFDKLDTDKDGKLSRREMTAALLAAMQQGNVATGG